MSNEKANVEVNVMPSPNCPELFVTIREGEALPPRIPTPIGITGNIDAPENYYRTHMSVLDPLKTWVEVDFERMSIDLLYVPQEDDRLSIRVSGILDLNKEFQSLKINQEHYYTNQELAKKLRFLRHLFSVPQEYEETVQRLAVFRGKIETDLQNVRSEQGHSVQSVERKWEGSTPAEFGLNMRLVNGFEPVKFKVSVGVDLESGKPRLFLYSVELPEILETTRREAMKKYSDYFYQLGNIAVIYKG